MRLSSLVDAPSLALRGLLLAALCTLVEPKRQHHHPHMRGRPYELTLYIRNHNVTDALFFRLVGVDNTADFRVEPGHTYNQTFQVQRKGYWTLFVEFPGDRYSKSPKKIISRDSYHRWVMEVYYYPGAVGFSEWHKLGRRRARELERRRGRGFSLLKIVGGRYNSGAKRRRALGFSLPQR